jgi:hypothetical protein
VNHKHTVQVNIREAKEVHAYYSRKSSPTPNHPQSR